MAHVVRNVNDIGPTVSVDLWLTIAQAYLGSDALNQLIGETFDQAGVQPIAGLWQSP